MNNFGRHPPLQCYGYKGPHKYINKLSDRQPLLCYNYNEPHKILDFPSLQTKNVPLHEKSTKTKALLCTMWHRSFVYKQGPQ